MPNTNQISGRLFKKDLGTGDTGESREFFEEPFESGVLISPNQILAEFDQVPQTAPSGMAHDEIQGVIQRKVDVVLTAVAGVSGSFQSDELKDAIPFNFGDGSYNYAVKDNADNPIAFGQGDWVVDTASGIIIFYGTVPANMPPKISFYKYVGAKGVGTGSGSSTYFIVPDIAGRDAIPVEQREEGIKSYVVNVQKEYQLKGGIDNTDWEQVDISLESRTQTLLNDSTDVVAGLFDIYEEQTKHIYYRADRGLDYDSGTILIDHKSGTVYYQPQGGNLNNLGITYDFNLNGNFIEMDYTVDNAGGNVVFSFIVGGVKSSNGTSGDNLGNHIATQNLNLSGYSLVDSSRTNVYIGTIPFPQTLSGEGAIFVERSGVIVQEPIPTNIGDMTKVVYDNGGKAADVYNMDNHDETATNKHYTSTEQTKLAGIDVGAQVNPGNTDALTEGATNLYYTDVRVDARITANVNITANTAARHIHTNQAILDLITDVGSGIIISNTERLKLTGIEVGAQVNLNAASTKSLYESNPDTNAYTDTEQTKLAGIEVGAQVNPGDTDAIIEGATNLYFTEARVTTNTNVAANTAARHTHTNQAILDLITDVGSGIIISVTERNKLAGIDVGAQVNPADTDAILEGAINLYFTGTERTKLTGIEVGAQVNPADTDAVPEGATNLYYTEAKVDANTNVAANTAARHAHTNITDLDKYTHQDLIKDVYTLSDFPTPVGDVITLEANISYRINGVVALGVNRIVTVAGNRINGISTTHSALSYTGTGDMFTIVDQNFAANRIALTAPNGQVFNAQDATGTKSFDISLMLISGCNTLGTLGGFYRLFVDRCYLANFNAGWIINDTIANVFFSHLHVDMVRNSGSGGVNFIEHTAAGHVTDSAGLQQSHIHTRNTGDYVIYLDPATNLTEGIVTTCSFIIIAGANAFNFDANTASDVVVTANIGVDDFVTRATMYTESDSTTTTISAANTWTKTLSPTTLAYGSRFTMPVNNRLQYNGTKSTIASVHLYADVEKLTSGSVDLEFTIFKNGVAITGLLTRRTFDVGTYGHISLGFTVSLDTNDYIEFYVRNTTNSDDVVIRNMQFVVD